MSEGCTRGANPQEAFVDIADRIVSASRFLGNTALATIHREVVSHEEVLPIPAIQPNTSPSN